MDIGRALVRGGRRYRFWRRAYWFGRVDSRPLAVFRLVFGLILLKDALYHLPLAGIFYSDSGIVPRAALLELARSDRFSLMDAMPHAWMAALLFLLWAGVALGLVVGYRTRLMAVLNFLIVMSVHDRNVYVLTGADTFIRAMSFWMMFVPLGGSYSLDVLRARRAGRSIDRTAYAFPVRMLQIQVALVYVFAGLLKWLGPMWRDGTAMFYVLQLDTLLLLPGVWLRETAPDSLLVFITHATLVGELLFAALVFAPVAQPLLRLAGLAFGAGLHIGIGLTMSIPDFSLVMLTSYLLFLQPEWIAAAETRLRRALKLPPPQPDDPPAETPASARLPRATLTALLATAMLGAIWWNVDYLGDYTDPLLPMPRQVRSVLWYTGLWQYWDLFAPMPLQVDGWITVPARFEDGREIDLRTGAPPDDTLQRAPFGPFARWEKFEENVYRNGYEPILRAWGRRYCREYNVIQALPEGERLATLEIRFLYRRAHAPGEPPNELTSHMLWKHWCYDRYAY